MQAAVLPATGPAAVPADRQRSSQLVSSRSSPVSALKRHRSGRPVRLNAQDQTGEGAAAGAEKFIYPGDILEEVTPG